VELTGRYSVIPSTMPRITALPRVISTCELPSGAAAAAEDPVAPNAADPTSQKQKRLRMNAALIGFLYGMNAPQGISSKGIG
jgi:hypothetical protein